MQGSSWVALINRIPEIHHDNLVAITSTGAEIMVQRIMRLEEHFIILRGRPAGSTEAGRILLLPWDQVNHVAFGKLLPEAEIQQIFGDGAIPSTPAAGAKVPDKVHTPPAETEVPAPTAPAPAASTPPATPAPASAPVPNSGPAAPAPAKSAPISKSILLARLRARMANNDIAKA